MPAFVRRDADPIDKECPRKVFRLPKRAMISQARSTAFNSIWAKAQEGDPTFDTAVNAPLRTLPEQEEVAGPGGLGGAAE